MRRLALAAVIALIGFAPFTVSAQTQAQTHPPAAVQTDYIYPLVLAAGALAGVATINMLTYSIGTLPLSVGMVSTAPISSPAAAAASRIFVITSGVIGAWIASALYGK